MKKRASVRIRTQVLLIELKRKRDELKRKRDESISGTIPGEDSLADCEDPLATLLLNATWAAATAAEIDDLTGQKRKRALGCVCALLLAQPKALSSTPQPAWPRTGDTCLHVAAFHGDALLTCASRHTAAMRAEPRTTQEGGWIGRVSCPKTRLQHAHTPS